MSEFTKGPWLLMKSTPEEGSELFYIKAQSHSALRGFSKVICEVQGPQDDSVQTANANLIAAAPDMLEALEAIKKDLLDRASLDSDMVKVVECSCSAWVQLQDAIAKAKGESQ